MLILGLNTFHADASAALVQDGEVVFAIAEERLNRIKHYAGFPSLAIKACLDFAGAKLTDIDHVAIGQDSDANLAQKVQYALSNPAKILNLIRLRQRKQPMRDVIPTRFVSSNITSSITSRTSPAPTTAHLGTRLQASATTAPETSFRR
jgi:predicted NodU family carbamoyl transferase